MKLSVQTRKLGTKGDVNKLRREGNIPGIIYSDAGAGTPISLSKDEMKAVVRNLQQPGILATTVFELNLGDKKQKVVVKDIQYHVVSYDILHMDFALLSDDKQVSVNVPITLDGKIDCVGLKLGGFMRQPVRTLKVSCLPKDIPQEFKVDIRDMNIGQSRTLSEIQIPSGVNPLAKMDLVFVVVGKKA